MAADAVSRLVGAHDHDRSVPADEGADAALYVLVAREERLSLRRNGVDVGSGDGGRDADVQALGAFEKAGDDQARPLLSRRSEEGVEGFQPLPGFIRIGVRQLVGEVIGHQGLFSQDKWRLRCGGGGWRVRRGFFVLIVRVKKYYC